MSEPEHSPDTQTEERCGGSGRINRPKTADHILTDTEPWKHCPGCPDCDPAPPDPQGQVERGERDCGVCGVGKWTGDEIVEVPVTHDGYSVPRCSIHRDCAPYQAESRLDQAERRVEEAKADASEANHQANMMSRNLQAANALAASYREGLRYILGEDVAGYDAHMRPDEVARKLLNPSSTGEGDA